jgi:hypothetical protein
MQVPILLDERAAVRQHLVSLRGRCRVGDTGCDQAGVFELPAQLRG